MRPKDLVFAGLAQIAVLSIGAGVVIGFRVGEPSLALVVGAIVGTQTGALLYHGRNREPAPVSVKAATGAVLAVVCVIAGVLIQAISGWMIHPDIVIPIGALGSFAFPFVLFGTMQKAITGGRKKQP
jgi:hypothetical protein